MPGKTPALESILSIVLGKKDIEEKQYIYIYIYIYILAGPIITNTDNKVEQT